ncbi:amidase [Daldinia vernicosa]|uniref:amidase n=1 Tax=Daldinia vernicosa TaxID=114800 RepID=UPI002008415A|nr:amidase [Daldinia vernicosa]KAI0848844.1 amidase [Daldinia vernicosa]
MSIGFITTASGASWQDVAVDRQRHRDATIAELHPPLPVLLADNIPLNTTSIPDKILTDEERTITGANVEDLLVKLATGEWSSTAVVQAFMRRAGLAQKLVNCVTELLPDRALRRAAELDEYLATHKKPIGPLHGLPISVKEHIGMKGLDMNGAFIGSVGNTAEKDAVVLEPLWDAGAVFYVRTPEPQTMMQLETSSNLLGETVNPYNTTLTPGGSSGGEGALIGLRGSVLGIGSDIGGSIRSPAAAVGIFGFKPTSGRIATRGWFPMMFGAEHIIPTNGPMSTSLAGLKIFTKTVVDGKMWLKVPSVVPMEWRDTSSYFPDRKLKVGVLWDDGVVKPHPPINRAMTELVEKLKKSENIELIDWKPWKHDLAWEIIASLYFADGGKEVISYVESSGEPFRPLSQWIIRDNPHVKEHTIRSLWDRIIQRDGYREDYAALWNETAKTTSDGKMVDVILCPAAPGVAAKLNTSKYWGYTSQWNLLDYPAVVFPVQDQVSVEKYAPYAYPADYKPKCESDEYNWNLWREHGSEGYRDAPICLQLVSRRFNDESLLEALEIILEEAGLPTTC